MHPQKHPKLWVLLLLLFSGQERVKSPFPLKASPIQVLARGPAQDAGVCPWPQDTPESRLSITLRCSIWTAPNGPSCLSLCRQAQQKQEQFLLPETGSCEGSILPQQGQGQPASPVPPTHGEKCQVLSLQPGQSSPCWCQE